jgi:hypothetical protein
MEVGEDGARYAYPPPLNGCGFFEDFFDAKRKTVSTFWQVVNQRLATTTACAPAAAWSRRPIGMSNCCGC